MENEVIQVPETKGDIVTKKSNGGLINKSLTVFREFIAAVFWAYTIIKLFIFDIDVWIIDRYLPNYSWIISFKFIILISIIAMILLITKNKHVLYWTLYILFYPIIIFFWKIPSFVLKQKSWLLAFALINTIISFFKSIKYNFITFALFLASFVAVFSFYNEKILWVAISTLLITLSVIYVRRFILVFRSSSIYQIYIRVVSATKNYGSKQTTLFALDENIKNVPVESLDQKQLEKWTTNLQTSVLFNRVCLFISKKLRDYQNSRINVASYVLTILVLIILTTFSFATINFGLFKINSEFFSYSTTPSFFTFFYYSFNNFVFNSIKEILPLAPIAQIVFMIEIFFALVVGAILISLFLSTRNQKHTEELNEVIEGIERQGAEMEGFIKDEYKIRNIEDAMVELEKLKAGLTKFIYKITESL